MNNRWTQFNQIIDDETLSKDEKALVITIFRFINAESGYCYASTETLMAKSRIGNRNTFTKARYGLVMKGYLQFNSVRGKGTIYSLTFTSEQPVLNTPRSEVVSEIEQNCTIKRNKKENKTEMNYYNNTNVSKLTYEQMCAMYNPNWFYEMSSCFVC